MINLEKFFLSNLFRFSKLVHQSDTNAYEVEVTNSRFFELVLFLKNYDSLQFTQLVDIAVFDRLSFKKRFNVVYILMSHINNIKLFLSLQTEEGSPISSIVNIFECASWIEREVWDMFGVYVLGNNDFRRILCDYGFKGHPLRKDYPLSGYFEILFDDHYTQLNYFPVEFVQEYRKFELISTWGQQEIL